MSAAILSPASNDNFNAPAITGARLIPSGRKKLAIELTFEGGAVSKVPGFTVRRVALAHMGQLLVEARKLGRVALPKTQARFQEAS